MDDNQVKVCQTCGREFKTETDFFSGTSRWRICTSQHLWFNCSCQSTLMIPAGKYPWYNPTKTLTARAQEVFNRLSVLRDFPQIPSLIQEVIQMLSDDTVEVNLVSRRLRQDPLLAAKVLELANNLKLRRMVADRKPITQIEHGITYIGRFHLADHLINLAFERIKPESRFFDIDQFWYQSRVRGAVAEYIAQRFKLDQSKDAAYLLGALSMIGHLVAAACFPDITDIAIQNNMKASGKINWRETAKRSGLPDLCVLGEIGAALWGLPPYVIDSAGHFLDSPSRRTEPTFMENWELAAFANQLTHCLLLEVNETDDRLLDEYCRAMRLDAQATDQLLQDLYESLTPTVLRA